MALAPPPSALVGLVVVGALDAGRDAGDDRLLRALVQTLATSLDRGQELVQVDLERGEDRVGPVLHLEPRLARLAAGVLDDLRGLALGELDDLGLRRLADGLLPRLAEDPVALALGLGQHLLAFLDDPAGLLDLLWDRRPHLVEDVVDLLAVDAHLVGQRDGLRVVDEVVELVDQNQYIHRFSESTEGTRLLSDFARIASRAAPARARAPAGPSAAARDAERRSRRSSGGRSASARPRAAGPRP